MSSFDWKKKIEACGWNLWRSIGEGLCSPQKMDQQVIQQKFYGSLRSIKLLSNYFLMVKILLGSLKLRWATASSRLKHVRSPLMASGASSI